MENQTPASKKFNSKKVILYGSISIVAIAVIYLIATSGANLTSQIGAVGSTHIHTDMAVFVNGNQITPLGPQYFVKSPYVHVEGGPGEGTVVHTHATNVPLNFFLKSLGMDLTGECFKLDTGENFCSNGDKTLKMFVKHANGQWEQNFDAGNYMFKNLDKILITYGNENPDQIKIQENSVTDFSKDN